MQPYYDHAGIQIYNSDCRDILPTLPKVDAVVSDPPYGMKWDGRVTRGKNGTGSPGPTRHYGTAIEGDDLEFNPAPFLGFTEVLLWGFNHFPDKLSRGSLLVWLKRYDDGFGSFLSDAEAAWFNSGHGVYCRRDVSLQGESKTRLHPTQKPIGIMRWCMEFVKGNIILDPFMGSGTTLVAAKQLNRRAIGIEIEEKYCEIAAKRLEQEVFDFGEPAPAPAEQIELLTGNPG